MTASTEEQPTPTTHRSPLTLFTVISIALLAVAVRVYLAVTTHSTAEDYYITLRYAENLAHGHGMVYNVGEKVLGTTTPLYTLFLALVAWLGMDPTIWGKGANILADGVSCWMLFRLGRAVGLPGAALVASALFALSPPNLTWAISGMETSLVTLAGLAVFVSLAEKRPTSLTVWSAILVLLRIDGVLLAGVALAALWLREKHFPASPVGLFVFLLLPWLAFVTAYYGSPIPTSVVAKLTVYAWHAPSTFPNLTPFAHQMTHSLLHKVLLAGALLGIWAVVRQHPLLLPAVVWMVTYYAAMAFSKGFLFGWYYVPPTPVYFLLAVVGWEYVCVSMGVWVYRSKVRFGLPSPSQGGLGGGPSFEEEEASVRPLPYSLTPKLPHIAVAVLVLAFGLRALPGVKAQTAEDQDIEERLRRPIGETLRSMIHPGEALMLEPIGYIGYFSGAKVLDAVGLVSPEVIPFFRQEAESPYLDIMAARKPEWVLLRAGEYEAVMKANVPADRRLEASYTLVREFRDPAVPPETEPAFYLFRRRSLAETPKPAGT